MFWIIGDDDFVVLSMLSIMPVAYMAASIKGLLGTPDKYQIETHNGHDHVHIDVRANKYEDTCKEYQILDTKIIELIKAYNKSK